jgi:hypothetical protein
MSRMSGLRHRFHALRHRDFRRFSPAMIGRWL